jgi:hypothetical protein
MKVDWYFIAENSLRLMTENFDLDIDLDNEHDKHYVHYVMAVGGMEHYIIFKNEKSLNKYKSDFIGGFRFIDLYKPINLVNGYIAFLIEFENN